MSSFQDLYLIRCFCEFYYMKSNFNIRVLRVIVVQLVLSRHIANCRPQIYMHTQVKPGSEQLVFRFQTGIGNTKYNLMLCINSCIDLNFIKLTYNFQGRDKPRGSKSRQVSNTIVKPQQSSCWYIEDQLGLKIKSSKTQVSFFKNLRNYKMGKLSS